MSLEEVGEGKAAVTSQKVKAEGGGSVSGVVGKAVGVGEGVKRRVVVVGTVGVCLELPGRPTEVGRGVSHESQSPRGNIEVILFEEEPRGVVENVVKKMAMGQRNGYTCW